MHGSQHIAGVCKQRDGRDGPKRLEVFLSDPDVPMDTNHVERALRPIPMGKKNWLFCWTEVGAEHAGIVQSLIATCRLRDIDPYTFLVDVLQRVGEHPASRVSDHQDQCQCSAEDGPPEFTHTKPSCPGGT